jgi:hypothetical protein
MASESGRKAQPRVRAQGWEPTQGRYRQELVTRQVKYSRGVTVVHAKAELIVTAQREGEQTWSFGKLAARWAPSRPCRAGRVPCP